jgi:hypothetical protein
MDSGDRRANDGGDARSRIARVSPRSQAPCRGGTGGVGRNIAVCQAFHVKRASGSTRVDPPGSGGRCHMVIVSGLGELVGALVDQMARLMAMMAKSTR